VLEHLRKRASEALATAGQVVLSTWGPADIQAERLACESLDVVFYVLVPRTSDLLFNLETNEAVVATAETWQVRGMARLLRPGQHPKELAITRTPQAAWCDVAEIRPTQLRLSRAPGQLQDETIDIF
jgi:hypothetical protein